MKVLVIGSGGREHVLVYLSSISPEVEEVYCFGQNAGIMSEKKWMPFDPAPTTIAEYVAFAKEQRIDLTIVGPEQYLADGIVDAFCAEGLSIFGPTRIAAQLEANKRFAKELMRDADVPTANWQVYGRKDRDELIELMRKRFPAMPIVLKAYGLAAGKGAMVCTTFEEAQTAIKRCLDKNEFGSAGDYIIAEGFLCHPTMKRAELSVLALVDIHGNFKMFPAAQDYKAVFSGDRGPNTGGMGAYARVPWVTSEMMDQIGQEIFTPTIQEMLARETPFSGVLYTGLMWTQYGPKVVEFNVRFGDPEIQPLSMLLDCDIIPILKTIADGKSIADVELKWKDRSAVCVVMASNGYPGSYKKGAAIKEECVEIPSRKVFHAGTKIVAARIVTDGGRVLGVTASGKTLSDAAELAYGGVSKIDWRDDNGLKPLFRNDIAADVPTSIASD